MRHLAGIFITALLALPGQAWLSNPAAAAQGALPEFWQSRETIVRVVDLPDAALYKRGYNDFVDLAYHFRPDGSGEWVGLSTSGRRETLDTIRLGMMLNAAGLDRLPDVPDRPASTATHVFFIANGLIQLGLVFRILMNKFKDSSRADRRAMRALFGRPKVGRKDKPQSQGIATVQRDGNAFSDAKTTPAILPRGLRSARVINAQFGRRG